MTDTEKLFTNPVFCAIDTPDLGTATTWAARISDHVGGLKLGLEFFSAHGPKGVKQVMKASDLPVFLDLKFHDIPNTVAGAVRAACALKPFMLNVHAGGGKAMMQAAAEAAAEAAYDGVGPRPLVIGVTVLTSLGDEDLAEVGMAGPAADQVIRLAVLAKESGLDGIVCSPREAARIRTECGPNFKLVTPGVRPDWAAANDQKRVMTPEEAPRRRCGLSGGRAADHRCRRSGGCGTAYRHGACGLTHIAMSIAVKICGLKDADALDAAVEEGADYIGFVFFEKSPRHIEAATAAELTEDVPENGRVDRFVRRPG